MIDPKELRIRNLVTDNFYETFKRVIEVESIGEKGINLSASDDGKPYGMHNGVIQHEYDFEEIYGIPLTPERLERMGFKKQKNGKDFTKIGYADSVYFLRWNEISKDIHAISVCHPNIDNSQTAFAWHIKHVHQLQNLYFALTGKELEIKP